MAEIREVSPEQLGTLRVASSADIARQIARAERSPAQQRAHTSTMRQLSQRAAEFIQQQGRTQGKAAPSPTRHIPVTGAGYARPHSQGGSATAQPSPSHVAIRASTQAHRARNMARSARRTARQQRMQQLQGQVQGLMRSGVQRLTLRAPAKAAQRASVTQSQPANLRQHLAGQANEKRKERVQARSSNILERFATQGKAQQQQRGKEQQRGREPTQRGR